MFKNDSRQARQSGILFFLLLLLSLCRPLLHICKAQVTSLDAICISNVTLFISDRKQAAGSCVGKNHAPCDFCLFTHIFLPWTLTTQWSHFSKGRGSNSVITVFKISFNCQKLTFWAFLGPKMETFF